MKDFIKTLFINKVNFIVLLFFLLFNIFPRVFAYNDFAEMCFIEIDPDPVKGRGSKDTIFQSINYLQKTDREGFRMLCQNIEKINESYCPINHENGGQVTFLQEAGCYIKGSRIVYLTPSNEISEEAVKLRAEALKKSAILSKSFWDDRQ